MRLMHLLAATVLSIHILVLLAALVGVIGLEMWLLAAFCLVCGWLWGLSLMVSAVRWPWRLFMQFWAGTGLLVAYEYARAKPRRRVQVCLVSVAWPA